MTTWEERMAAKAEARARERRMGHDTVTAAERAELKRWAILPPPDGATGPRIEHRSPWWRVCTDCYPMAEPRPDCYVWSAETERWDYPLWDVGPHIWGLLEPELGEGPERLGTCRHWCHYVAYAVAWA